MRLPRAVGFDPKNDYGTGAGRMGAAVGRIISGDLGLGGLFAAFWIAGLLAGIPISVFAEAGSVDWSSVVRADLPAIVNISVETLSKDPKDGTVHRERDLGTGFFISSDGLILTNRHVISGAFRITVTTSDRLQWNAELVAAGKIIDLAVLKIDTGKPTAFLEPADSDAIHVGDPLLVIGNPLGLGTSASAGIVSARNRNLRNTPFDDYIQTDAAINHGNSGGPVLDQNGAVAGIATILVTQAADQGSSGLGFAIPSKDAYQAVRHLLDPTSLPVGWIGVHLQDVTPDLAWSFGIPEPRGQLITQIDSGSPAEMAGLRSGDIILSYRGISSPDSSALMWDIILSPVGQPAAMTIRRQGQVISSSVMVADWPDLHEAVSALISSPP